MLKDSKLKIILQKKYFIFWIIVMSIGAFNLFYKLDSCSVKSYDEARHGVSAYEMLKNNSFIINTYGGKVDYWNLKPPLGMILIAISYKILGIKLISLRIVSAISALTCIAIIMWLTKNKINKEVSIMSGLCLAVMSPFINIHSGRTGDFDSLFTLLMLVSMICILEIEKNKKNLYFSGLIIGISFLLKSYAINQIIILIILYLIISKNYNKIKIKEYIIFIFMILLPIIIWFLFRYEYDKFEFVKKMITIDVLKRSTNNLEAPKRTFLYYVNINIQWYYYLFITGILLYIKLIYNKKEKLYCLKNEIFIKWLLLYSTIPFFIFSLVQTKHSWYVNTIYPPLAIIIAWITYKLLIESSLKVKSIIFIFLVSTIIVSEVIIIRLIKNDGNLNYYYSNKMSQEIIYNLKHKHKLESTSIYLLDSEFKQAQFFVAEVMNNLVPKSIGDKKNFILEAKPKDLLLLEKQPQNLNWIKENSLHILEQNEKFIVVEK